MDLHDGDVSELIGFDKRVVAVTSYSEMLPNITRETDSLLVHWHLAIDLIVVRRATDVILDFFVEYLKLRYPFSSQIRVIVHLQHRFFLTAATFYNSRSTTMSYWQ